MFEIGWLELIVIGIVALIVVGPKDLPGMFRTVGRFMGKMRGMAREFQRAMEDAAKESGLKEAADGLNKIHDVARPGKTARNFAKDFMKETKLDDLGEMEADIESAMADLPKSKPAPAPKSPVPPAAEAPKPAPEAPKAEAEEPKPSPAAASEKTES